MYFNENAFGSRIRALRQHMGISMEDMASMLMISVNYLGKIERGARVPSFDFVIQFALTFGVSTDYLLLGSDAKQRPINELALTLAEQLQAFVLMNNRERDNPSLLGTSSP